MERRTVLSMLPAVALAQEKKTPRYEEDLLATMPVRERNWKQLENFSSNLEQAKSLPAVDFSSPHAYRKTIEPLRQLLRSRTGYPPPGFYAEPGEPRLEKTGEDATASYHRMWIPVGPDIDVYGLYIVPKKAKLPAPLVISKHGGVGTPELATFHGGTNYHDMVRGAVDQGYVVFAPLTIMLPTRDRDNGSPIPPDIRKRLDARLRASGTSLAAVEVFKIVKALDALVRRKEVDAKRIGMVGLSYGGYYTLYTAALEPRITASVASCSFRDTPAGDDWKNPEGRLIDLPSADLVKLICPRPLQVQAGVKDKGFPIDDVRRGIEKSTPCYQKLGLRDKFVYEEFEGGHEFRGDIAWRFLKKHL